MTRDFLSVTDCCGLPTASSQDEKAIRFWNVMAPQVDELWQKAWRKIVLGQNSQCAIDAINDVNYLFLLLQIIERQRQLDRDNSSDGYDQGDSYYSEEYNMECIRKHFMCKGIKTDDGVLVYGVHPVPPLPGEEHDGIGYMSIENALPPINRVRGPND